jgi:hypothetical protein
MLKNESISRGPVSEALHQLVERLGVPSSRQCPHCASIIYSRKSGSCGVCGQPLPEACRLNAAETARVNAVLPLDRQRHRAWLHRREGSPENQFAF